LYIPDYLPGNSESGLLPGISVFDTSTPAAPSFVTRVAFDQEELPFDIAGYGNRLWISSLDMAALFGGNHRFDTYDLSDPDAPALLTAESEVTTSIQFSMAVEPDEQALYAYRFPSGLIKWDVSTGSRVEVATGALFAGTFAVKGGYIYVPGWRDVTVYDATSSSIVSTGYACSAAVSSTRSPASRACSIRLPPQRSRRTS